MQLEFQNIFKVEHVLSWKYMQFNNKLTVIYYTVYYCYNIHNIVMSLKMYCCSC